MSLISAPISKAPFLPFNFLQGSGVNRGLHVRVGCLHQRSFKRFTITDTENKGWNCLVYFAPFILTVPAGHTILSQCISITDLIYLKGYGDSCSSQWEQMSSWNRAITYPLFYKTILNKTKWNKTPSSTFSTHSPCLVYPLSYCPMAFLHFLK